MGSPRFEGDTTHERMTLEEAKEQLLSMIKPRPVVDDDRKMDGKKKIEAQVAGLYKLVTSKELLAAEWAPAQYLAKVLGGSTTIFGMCTADWAMCPEWDTIHVDPLPMDVDLSSPDMDEDVESLPTAPPTQPVS